MTIVLKVGGSVITDKATERRLDDDALDGVVDALADHLEGRAVLVHGGGSFGHPVAARHGVTADDGTTNPTAIAEIHGAMLTLNGIVVDRLIAAGIPAVGLHPLSMASRDAGDLHLSYTAVTGLLGAGFMPVLHGDGVVDGDEVTILSGDELVVALASELAVDRVGLCTATGGVAAEDGHIIERITSYDAVAATLESTASTDVTGGMATKVRHLLALNQPASIFGTDDLPAFLAGESPGTTVESAM